MMTTNNLWLSCFAFWSVCMLVCQPADATEKVLSRHARAMMPMMLDMRGTPDLLGECSGAGYLRNNTDCTQFYRCVDFVRNGKHTIFRFMCGPGTVFDQSRSLCVRPSMSNPPCPTDQLSKITPAIITPLTPTKQVVTAAPVTTARPAVPAVEITPIVPAVPVAPVTTARPAVPAVEITPIVPAVPVAPVTTARPAVPTVEIIPIVPAVTAAPVTTARPVIPIVPVTPIRPAVPVLPAGLNVPATIPKEFGERLSGFVTFDFGELEESSSVIDITMKKESFFGMILDGSSSQITIKEQGVLAKEWQFTIPSGAILAIHTTQDGGKITNLRDGLFSTSLTTMSYAPGTTFMIMLVDSTGLFYIHEVLMVTTTTVEFTVPAYTLMGSLTFDSHYYLTHIGIMTFSTQYVLSETTTSISFGLLYSETIEYTTLIIRSTIYLPGFDKFLSGIMPMKPTTALLKEEELTLVNGDLMAIVPAAGRGSIKVLLTDWSEKEYNVAPGSIFAVKVAGSSVIRHLSYGHFTTEKTLLSFPAQSVIYLMKVTVDGTLVPDVEIKMASAFTINVAKQSLVGVVRRSINGVITSIGKARLQIQPIAFSSPASSVAFFGLLNLIPRPAVSVIAQKPVISTVTINTPRPVIPAVPVTQRPFVPGPSSSLIPAEFGEKLAGFLTVEDKEQSLSLVNISLAKDSFFGMIPDRAASQILIKEQGSLSKKWQLSVPSGAMLAIYTTRDGGKITNLRNGLFSTNITTMTFAPGTTFMSVLIDANGLFYVPQVFLVTESTVEVTLPVRSAIGSLAFTSQYILTSFGGMPFGTYNMYMKSETTTFRTFGVIYAQSQVYTELVLRSNIDLLFPNYEKFLLGMMPLRSFDVEAKEKKLILEDGNLFAIIPAGGRGIVKVEFLDAVHNNYFVSPGSVFAVRVAGSSVIENLSRGYFTTERTVLSFPAGSVFYVMKVAIDGTLVPDVEIKAESAFTLSVVSQSLVGVIRMSENGVMTTFGEARFQIQPITSIDISAPVTYLGLLHLVDRRPLEKTETSGVLSLPSVQLTPGTGKLSISSTPTKITTITNVKTQTVTLPTVQVNTQKIQLPSKQVTLNVKSEPKITTFTSVPKTVTITKEVPTVQVNTQKIQLPSKQVTLNVKSEPKITTFTSAPKTVTITKEVPTVQVKTQKIQLPAKQVTFNVKSEPKITTFTSAPKTVTITKEVPTVQIKTQKIQLPSKQVTLNVKSEPKITTQTTAFTSTPKIVAVKQELPTVQVNTQKIQLPSKQVTLNVKSEPKITTFANQRRMYDTAPKQEVLKEENEPKIATVAKNLSGKLLSPFGRN